MTIINNINIDKLDELSKKELIEIIKKLNDTQQTSNNKRKDEVLKLLRIKPMTISSMAEQLKISNANISSQLTYLRRDGFKIYTDDKKRKMLIEDK